MHHWEDACSSGHGTAISADIESQCESTRQSWGNNEYSSNESNCESYQAQDDVSRTGCFLSDTNMAGTSLASSGSDGAAAAKVRDISLSADEDIAIIPGLIPTRIDPCEQAWYDGVWVMREEPLMVLGRRQTLAASFMRKLFISDGTWFGSDGSTGLVEQCDDMGNIVIAGFIFDISNPHWGLRLSLDNGVFVPFCRDHMPSSTLLQHLAGVWSPEVQPGESQTSTNDLEITGMCWKGRVAGVRWARGGFVEHANGRTYIARRRVDLITDPDGEMLVLGIDTPEPHLLIKRDHPLRAARQCNES